ncbi:MAG: hypothetical protein H7329_08755, partial [Opitutaceae bacterium]|nr:hypothetical protein [Cytophagales bacterium]
MLNKIAFYFFLSFLQVGWVLGQSPKTDTIPSLPPKSEATLERDSSDNNSWLSDTTFKTKKHSAKRATLYSAVVPGLGQIYNRQYYKPPIIVGLGVLFAYLIIDNNINYVEINKDLEKRDDNKLSTTYNTLAFPSSKYDQYDASNPDRNKQSRTYDDIGLRNLRDSYRRDRDFYIILATLTYALNIVDAAVFAHLREFEVNDKLT